jgi:hypothetical protein
MLSYFHADRRTCQNPSCTFFVLIVLLAISVHVSDSRTPPIVVRRYPTAFLCDVAYGIAPMTTELAETIRTFRKDYGVDYAALGFYLCETNPDGGASFGLGKALTELAAMHLEDKSRAWI